LSEFHHASFFRNAVDLRTLIQYFHVSSDINANISQRTIGTEEASHFGPYNMSKGIIPINNCKLTHIHLTCWPGFTVIGK